MSLAISQINLLVITIIASALAAGSLAIFNFANNLQSFPVGIFGISFAIAAFPTLSAVAFNRKKLIQHFSQTTRHILFFIVPATVLLLTLRAQIIRVILGTGKFDWEDTVLTMTALGFFSISLFAQALIPLLIRMYYSRRNTIMPFVIGLLSAMVNVVLSLVFSAKMGVAGLALAYSFANIFNFILLWISLHLEIGSMDEFKIFTSAVKFSASAIACGIVVQISKLAIWPFINMEKLWGVLAQGLAAGSAGIVAYLAVSALLQSEEFFYFFKAFKCRILKKKADTGDHGEARGI
jgi:putative peptidoglycan lipid II flippase